MNSTQPIFHTFTLFSYQYVHHKLFPILTCNFPPFLVFKYEIYNFCNPNQQGISVATMSKAWIKHNTLSVSQSLTSLKKVVINPTVPSTKIMDHLGIPLSILDTIMTN